MKRIGEISRSTKETKVELTLTLDGTGNIQIDTGIGFLNHILTSLAFHGGFDLSVKAKGDLDVDTHHTLEDVGIALGEALLAAMGDKKGIQRFGWALCPMDEALVRTAIDLSGRPEFHFTCSADIRELNSDPLLQFFKALALSGRLTFHLDVLKGVNHHHTLEAMSKSTAKALKYAVEQTHRHTTPSTKGMS